MRAWCGRSGCEAVGGAVRARAKRHDLARGGRALDASSDSYHCSRYNTNTGVLTTEMFRAVFADVREFLKTP